MRGANSKCMPISCLFIYYSRILFQYFKICLISHDSVTTQSFENGRIDSACFFTESTQSPTLIPTAGITNYSIDKMLMFVLGSLPNSRHNIEPELLHVIMQN